jgi:hypothetical protein
MRCMVCVCKQAHAHASGLTYQESSASCDQNACVKMHRTAKQCTPAVQHPHHMLHSMHHSRLEICVMCYACGSLHLPTSCTLRTLLKMRQVCNAQCFFLVWYSRNSENNTSKYPDLAADVPKLLKQGCKSVVLDCEAVAYDRITKKILPFQVSVLLQCQAVNK